MHIELSMFDKIRAKNLRKAETLRKDLEFQSLANYSDCLHQRKGGGQTRVPQVRGNEILLV